MAFSDLVIGVHLVIAYSGIPSPANPNNIPVSPAKSYRQDIAGFGVFSDEGEVLVVHVDVILD